MSRFGGSSKDTRRDRHGDDPKTSVKAPSKKSGGGGKWTIGRPGDEYGATVLDKRDPNYDPDEKRVDPEDGTAYTFDELQVYYKGKYKFKALQEYWDNECTPVTRRRNSKDNPKAKAKAEKPAEKPKEAPQPAKAKAWVKKELGKKTADDMNADGPLARDCAKVIPYFPYKKLDKFYDIQGLLKHPKLFNAVCAVMAKRYKALGATKIVGFEARGFLFTPVALKVGVPFVMLRKGGKMPNTISSAPYTKEYAGNDIMCVQKGAIEKGDKVILIDDLIATGGTLCAGIELMKACEAEVTECSCMIELKALNGREKVLKAGAKDVWGFISEDLLQTKADLPSDYVDDGAAH